MNALEYMNVEKRHWIDETPRPDWGKGPDGRSVRIADDQRFVGLFEQWQADACDHPTAAILGSVNAGNQLMYRWYCRSCGCVLSSNIKHEIAEAHGVSRAHVDEAASRAKRYQLERQERLEKLIAEAAERAQPVNRKVHQDYFHGEHWQQLRKRILARAGDLCEGCLNASAEHVHHLTYRNFGNEFAWELRAVCADCHERVHGLTEA